MRWSCMTGSAKRRRGLLLREPFGRSQRWRWQRRARSSPPACRGRARWKGCASAQAGLSREPCGPGALYIDHTTNAPALVRRVHALLAAKGVAMVDAPVSGGMEGAQTRDLLAMAGGSPEDFARAQPLLEAIAKRVMYTGGIGTGSIAKIMHNSATFTLDLVMAECWTTGVKAGIDAATLVKVFNEAALGHMMNLKVRLPATYLQGNFDPRFSLALARKDLGLALDLARETETPMRLAAICEQEMKEAIARGWADRDASIFFDPAGGAGKRRGAFVRGR